MPRLFVAIPLPDEAKDHLVAVQPPAIPGVRLLGREELHLTLHFLGEVAAHDLAAMRAVLATIEMNAFTVAVEGIGMFERDGRPQVLWAGVEPNADLTALHRAIGDALAEAIGFRPEERPYSPHITLARLNLPVPSEVIDRYLEENKGFGIPSVLIDRFVLYSSNFADNVPHYQEKAVFRLREKESPLIRAWREAAQDLGVEIVAPYVLELSSGEQAKADVLVKDFGPTLVATTAADKAFRRLHDQIAAEGYGYSVFYGEELVYDRRHFIEILKDWGWTGDKDRRPDWCK